MAFLDRRAAKKYKINAQILGGLTTGTGDMYSGLPVMTKDGSTDTQVALKDVFGAADASGSIIQAINKCLTNANFTAGNGIIIDDPSGATDGTIAAIIGDSAGLSFVTSSAAGNPVELKLDLHNSTAADVDVENDAIMFLDTTDSSNKKTTIAAMGTALTGSANFNGILSSTGSLSVLLGGLDGTATAAMSEDFFAMIDSDSTSKISTFANLLSGFAGASKGGIAVGSNALTLDISELDAETMVAADSLVFNDADSVPANQPKKTTVDGFCDAIDGKGMGASGAGAIIVDMNSLDAAGVTLANDSIGFIDATDNSSKKESIVDLVNAMVSTAGGIDAASGVLSVDLNEMTDTAVDGDADSLVFIDATDNSSKKQTITGMAVQIANNSAATTGLSGSLEEDTAAANGGPLTVALKNLTAGVMTTSDSLVFVDATDNSSKKVTVADFVDDLDGGAGIGVSSDKFVLDLNELSAADVAVGSDLIAFVDDDASDATKKESIADLVSGMAGDGLTESSGQFVVGSSNATWDEAMLQLKGTNESGLTRTYVLGISGSVLVVGDEFA